MKNLGPVPDMLFHTVPKQPADRRREDAKALEALLKPRLSQEDLEPKLSLKTHQKAIDAWKEATESWKKRCLLAEKNRDELYDAHRAWREVASDLTFGGRPYPETGTPERKALYAKYQKVYDRLKASREAGHPEEGPFV